MQDRYLSPLRYPGGKAKLAPYLKLLLSKNALDGTEYAEVYAGGASVALSLLLAGYASRIHINDVDPGVYAFWHSVLNRSDELCALIRRKRVSVAEWERQKKIYHDRRHSNLLELGFATFFLNRTNRSGIIASGGMIGGRAQSGEWRLDCRFNKRDLIDRIARIATHKKKINLYRRDGADFLCDVVPKLPTNTFIYLDPPYYVKGKRRLYSNFYEHEDHVETARLLGKLENPWMVSYDDMPEVRKIYREFRSRRFELSYTVRSREMGEEVVFFSSKLSIPRVSDPVAQGLKRLATNSRVRPYSPGLESLT